MDLNQYVTQALTTESRPETIQINLEYLNTIVTLLVAAGNLLDVIKKDSWYGLPKTEEKLAARIQKLSESLDNIQIAAAKLPTLTGIDKLEKQELPVDPRITHGIIGSTTESVELLEAFQAAVARSEYDKVNLGEELGDIYWYLAIILDATGTDWAQVLQTNISKLQQRNKKITEADGFNASATINRDVVAERSLLEAQLT